VNTPNVEESLLRKIENGEKLVILKGKI